MRLLIQIALALTSVSALAQEPVELKSGFLTGQTYMELSQSQRKAYAMGLVEGIFLAPMLGAKKANVLWVEQCATGMTDSQLSAVIDQFVQSHPVRWHEPMHNLGLVALKQACQQQ